MVTLVDVRRWDPARITSAFTGLGTARDDLLGVDDELRTAAPPQGWTGVAADAARAEHDRVAERLRRVTAGIAALRPSLAAAADAVAAVRRDLDHADRLADLHGFTISADATVTDARHTVLPLDQVEVYQQRRRVEQGEIRTVLDSVLRRATALDRELADLLTRAAAEQVDDGTATTLAAADTGGATAVGVLPTPPPTGTPAENNRWWARLDRAEQDRVIAEHPAWVGNRNGIPATVRDRANRALLRTETARLDREITAAAVRWRSSRRGDVERLQGQRDALGAVTAALAAGPDRQLLLLDVSGHDQPRAAIGVGNLDTADHVAVFTPGFTTTVAGSIVDHTDGLDGVQLSAQFQLTLAGRGGETVAGVAWLGYDAPQVGNLASPSDSVASSAPAQEGGRDLAGFLDGVTAARADDPHLTALGHSYGSSTTGYALQQTAAADDVVLFGSPGTSTDDLADLRVPPGHTAVLEARWDAVADVAHFGDDPNHLDGVTNLSSRDEVGPDGQPLRESIGHSDYLTPGTTSQHNIAATVAGLPDRRIIGGNSGVGDWLW